MWMELGTEEEPSEFDPLQHSENRNQEKWPGGEINGKRNQMSETPVIVFLSQLKRNE